MGPKPRILIPDLSRKVAIVTGGHTGLGFGTSIELAKAGARVYIAGRSETKFDHAKQEILAECAHADLRFLPVDLADLSSVQRAAQQFTRQESRLHLLVNNAGVNYIGHFLLTKILLPTLQETAKTSPEESVRIINVSSDGHAKLAPKKGIVFPDANMKEGFSVWARYGHSKLANVLHAREMAERYPDILSLSLHPGTVKTNLSAGPIASTPIYRLLKPLVGLGASGPRKGAANILFAAVSPTLKPDSANGAYLLPTGKLSAPSKAGSDPNMARELWIWTEKELAERGLE
ncbi:hypothetical protein BJY04DRAFT_223273 [Aspergillus karnatakaensis]|uniref:uncharacterized protein n=1 Tax=Aspergillus karnatakaensis TaxID=1810916 RepID=UPI003CCD4C7C